MLLFKPDIFSQSIPKWENAPKSLVSQLRPILQKIIPSINVSNLNIEYSGALELNSSNYRVSTFEKKFVIKKWAKEQQYKNLLNLEKIIFFLNENEIPVANVIPFKNGQTIIKENASFWTCSNFVAGEFYSGEKDQLKQASILTAKTTTVLNKLPKELYPDKRISYKIEDFLMVLKKILGLRNQWEKIFGNETQILLETNLDNIVKQCNVFKHSKIQGGPITPNHFDMHPHNILFQGNSSTCLLDLESIVKIPIGFSIAYSALKQCRQFIAFNQDIKFPSQIGKVYLDTLKSNLKIKNSDDWLDNFSTMAQIETMRRITIIFQLNLEGNKKWNKVLPILLNNFHEAEELFN